MPQNLKNVYNDLWEPIRTDICTEPARYEWRVSTGDLANAPAYATYAVPTPFTTVTTEPILSAAETNSDDVISCVIDPDYTVSYGNHTIKVVRRYVVRRDEEDDACVDEESWSEFMDSDYE